MKRKKLRIVLITAVSVLLVLVGAACLMLGRSYEIKFSTPQHGETSVCFARGKVMGVGFGMSGDVSHLAERNDFSNADVKYIAENITGKGYSKEKIIEKITQYAESRGGRVSEIKKSGYVFVGIDWIKNKQ